jgi:hypothetical protein
MTDNLPGLKPSTRGSFTISPQGPGLVGPISTWNRNWNDSGYSTNVIASPMIVSYRAIMDSFEQQFTGVVQYNGGSHGGAGDVSTAALTTNLALTTDFNVVAVNLSEITSAIAAQQTSSVLLARALEELFQNVSLSFFKNTLFLEKVSSSSPITNVTIYTSYNKYVHSPGRLWLACGIAILVSSISVTTGCTTLLGKGLSYSNDFSSDMRVTRSREIDALVAPEDRVGNDPLPDHIKKGQLYLTASAAAALDAERQTLLAVEAKHDQISPPPLPEASKPHMYCLSTIDESRPLRESRQLASRKIL